MGGGGPEGSWKGLCLRKCGAIGRDHSLNTSDRKIDRQIIEE